LLLVDAGATGLSLVVRETASRGDRSAAWATLTLTSYVIGPPLVHGSHGHGRRALASLGLRVAAPLLLGALGARLRPAPPCETCRETIRSDGAVAGLTAGVLLAMAADAALLGGAPRAAAAPRSGGWAPVVSASPRGAVVSLSRAL
jgi:hypothetical protein